MKLIWKFSLNLLQDELRMLFECLWEHEMHFSVDDMPKKIVTSCSSFQFPDFSCWDAKENCDINPDGGDGGAGGRGEGVRHWRTPEMLDDW